jgi:hypothetical protein
MIYTQEQRAAHEREVRQHMVALGWKPLGGCNFERKGKAYDLSAADLSQLDRIEREGLFPVFA